MNQETSKFETIETYRKIVVQANKETLKKEAFISLLTQIYGSSENTKKVIDAITSGNACRKYSAKKQIRRGYAL